MFNRNNKFLIHEKHDQKLMLDFYKYHNGLFTPKMKEIFSKRDLNYFIRENKKSLFKNPHKNKGNTTTVF